jgi:hypothetical protein
VLAIKVYEEFLSILKLGTNWSACVITFTSHHFTPGEGTPNAHCVGRWVGPRDGLKALNKTEMECESYYLMGKLLKSVELGTLL